jgi:uncharacterized protein involved in outer membrane biogenesis
MLLLEKERIMKKGRIMPIIVLVLGLAVAGSVIYVLTSIDVIVKTAIEKYGSQATKTDVNVSSVNIRLSAGAGAITRLTVANPPGFSSRNIFSLGNISTRIDVKSVARSPVVIQEVRITGPEVFYEINQAGTSNLDVLKKNLERSPAKKAPEEKKSGGKEIKLFIRKLVFEKGRVEVRVAALSERPFIVDLPRLELKDIGRNGGATPAAVATTISAELAREAARAVARSQGEQYLRRGAEDLLKRYLRK